jgi:hypothetical protein
MTSPQDQALSFVHGRDGASQSQSGVPFTSVPATDWHPSDAPQDPHEQPWYEGPFEPEPVPDDAGIVASRSADDGDDGHDDDRPEPDDETDCPEADCDTRAARQTFVPGPFSRSRGL